MPGECRKGWQLPRSPKSFLEAFLCNKSSEKLEGSTAHPSPTAPVSELGLGSPGLTNDGLGRISDFAAPPLVQQEGLYLRAVVHQKGCSYERIHQ